MQSTWKHLGAFFLLALATLFFVSPNSYTHDLFDQYDTAWFFTCGKAWMCGMTPYVDFADSKGPLLWLIYGVGYLLSPYNYIGVFWLSVLAYTGVFYYVFSIARLFLTDDRKSYLVTVLMLLSYFCPWFHYEVRAEDWCQIFIAMSFYYCCRWLYADQAKAPKKGYQACFVLGVSLAGTLLIKYTITAMLGIVAIYMLYVIIRQRLNLFFSFLSLLSGFALVTLPFVIYMLLVGNFGAFIQEYFLNTLQTVQSSNSAGTYLREWLKLTGDARFAILFIIGCVGTYLMGEMVEKDKYFFFVSFLAFYAIAIHHCDDIIPYYLCACLLFPLFFIIPIVSITEISLRFRKRLFAFSFCATIFANAFSHGWLLSVWFFRDNDARADYYKIAYIMSKINNPTIVHYMASENGRGLPVGTLPGTKYWAYQLGATDEMVKDQENSIKAKKTDFVVINDWHPGISKRDRFVRASGYKLIYQYSWHDVNFNLYSKHDNLLLPPTDFHVSNMDVLLKRNFFNK